MTSMAALLLCVLLSRNVVLAEHVSLAHHTGPSAETLPAGCTLNHSASYADDDEASGGFLPSGLPMLYCINASLTTFPSDSGVGGFHLSKNPLNLTFYSSESSRDSNITVLHISNNLLPLHLPTNAANLTVFKKVLQLVIENNRIDALPEGLLSRRIVFVVLRNNQIATISPRLFLSSSGQDCSISKYFPFDKQLIAVHVQSPHIHIVLIHPFPSFPPFPPCRSMA